MRSCEERTRRLALCLNNQRPDAHDIPPGLILSLRINPWAERSNPTADQPD